MIWRPRKRGDAAEEQALGHLRDQGLAMVARNYSVRGGEIDLIMREGDLLVFVEVRYRRSERFGSAAESVDRRKQQRLLLAANHYLQSRGGDHQGCRFDVVALGGDGGLHWIRDAFRVEA